MRLLTVVLCLLVFAPLHAVGLEDYLPDNVAYDSTIPKPADVLGFEVGEWHGRHYFTMEFIEGRPLHEVMMRPRLGVRADCSRAAESAARPRTRGRARSPRDTLIFRTSDGLARRRGRPMPGQAGRPGRLVGSSKRRWRR